MTRDEIARRERRARSAAKKLGLSIRKSRFRHPELRAAYGGFMLVSEDNVIVAGANPRAFSMSLVEVEDFVLREGGG